MANVVLWLVVMVVLVLVREEHGVAGKEREDQMIRGFWVLEVQSNGSSALVCLTSLHYIRCIEERSHVLCLGVRETVYPEVHLGRGIGEGACKTGGWKALDCLLQE